VSGGKILPQAVERMEERSAHAGEREEHLAQRQQSQNDQDEDRQAAELRAPVPIPAPRNQVVLLEAGIGAVQAGGWDQLAREDLDQAAEPRPPRSR